MSVPAYRTKRCGACREQFTPQRSMQKVCSGACGLALAKVKREKEEKAATKARREAIKTRSEWLAEVQVVVNRYCRLRDTLAGYGCITCGARPEAKFGGAMDAGHWLSRGSHPQHRLNTFNIALQCVKENRYAGGAPLKFRAALIERIGLERVERLESDHRPAKFDIPYLKRFKRIFAKRAARLKKRIDNQQETA